jgi:hypothetical protein
MVSLINPANQKILQRTANGWIDDKGNVFLIKNGVVCVVAGEDYANNFGFQ